MAERFLPIYMLALGGSALAVGLLQAMDNLLSALYSFPGGYFSDRFGTKQSLFVFNLVALLLQQWMIEDDSPESLRSADSRGLALEKNPLKLMRLMNPQTNLITAFVFGIIGTAGFALFGRDTAIPKFG